MADKDYKIQISTTADTKGLDDATKAIDRTTDATEKATEATKELTDAEKEREERRQAYEQRRAERRAGGTAAATGGTSSDINPMTDGSQLRAAKQEMESLTRATEEHADAVRDVAEAEDDVAAALDRERQAQEDVAEARRRVRDRELEQIKRNRAEEIRAAEVAKGNLVLKAAAVTMVAQTWHKATEEVLRHIEELRELSPEAAQQFELIEAAAKFVRNPINAIFDEITAGTKRAIEGAIAADKRAKEMARAFEEAAAARKKETEEANRNTIEGVLSRELALINEKTAAFERQLRVRQAQLDAEEALARVADAQAIAAGADPTAVAEAAERRRQGRAGDDISVQVARAEQAYEAAAAAEQALVEALAATVATAGSRSDAAKEARAKLGEATQRAEDAWQELAAIRQIADANTITLKADSQAVLLGKQGDIASAITEQGLAVLDAIQQRADATGRAMVGDTKRVFDDLARMLGDNIPDAQQIDAIQARIQAFKNTQEGANRETRETIDTAIDTLNEVRGLMQNFRGELNKVQQDILNLQQNQMR